jgi:hypothetical protein
MEGDSDVASVVTVLIVPNLLKTPLADDRPTSSKLDSMVVEVLFVVSVAADATD